jgi:histone H3/H4
MDVGAKRLLETVTIETLHAQHFSRASSQATSVLTDLLSRYLTLLSTTCAKYAEHAGRLRLNARDAESALHELGLDVAELREYCTVEGREMSRYAVHTARRVEDLNEFKGQFIWVNSVFHVHIFV